MLHKKKIIILILSLLLFISILLCICFISKDNFHITVYGNKYNYNTVKNLDKDLKKNKPVFDNENLNNYVTYKADINSILNASLITRIKYSITKEDLKPNYTISFNKNKLRETLNESNMSADYPQDAFITKDNDTWKINKEVKGSFILVDDLLKSLSSSTTKIDLNKFYKKPNITEKDLKPIFKKISKYQDWSCKYSNGNEIRANGNYVDYNSSTNEITVSDKWIKKEVKKALSDYNTVGKERDFITHDGQNITVSGGTWGNSPNIEKEITFLKEKFNKGESITDREPEYNYQYDEFPNTYIEISIEQQHLWVYHDSQLIMETDIVTGDATKHRDTPTGCYFISEHINGKYLTGENYKTWVNKWMRLTNQGVGLHDAKWQPRFGGNRYKGHGSHGCINLPPKFASDLFDTVSVGWLVVIY